MKSYVVVSTTTRDGKEVKEIVLWTCVHGIAKMCCGAKGYNVYETYDPALEIFLAYDGGFRCWHGGIPDAWKEVVVV